MIRGDLESLSGVYMSVCVYVLCFRSKVSFWLMISDSSTDIDIDTYVHQLPKLEVYTPP